MKRHILILICAAFAPFLCAQETAAGPVTFVVNKTAQVAHRVAYGFNRHVVQPARRVIVRHTS